MAAKALSVVDDQPSSLSGFDIKSLEPGWLYHLASSDAPVTRSTPNRFTARTSMSFDFSETASSSSVAIDRLSTTLSSLTLDPTREASMRIKAQQLQQRPLTYGILQRIVPVDVFTKLAESSITCVSLTKTSQRCKIKIRCSPKEAADLLEVLNDADVRGDWNSVSLILRRLIEVSLCGSPHGRIAKAEHLALDYRMTQGNSEQGTADGLSNHLELISTHVKPWLKTICKNSQANMAALRSQLDPTDLQTATPLLESSNKIQPRADASLSNASSPPSQSVKTEQLPPALERIQYIQAFQPYQPYNIRPYDVSTALKMALQRPLDFKDLEPKYLYIYWSPGNFGFVKIGVTDNVPNRLRQWEEQCKHEAKEHLPRRAGERVLISHAYRVEELVHTELKDMRHREIRCKGCQKPHIEWFRTTPDHAARVIKKYADWTATSPYPYDVASRKWMLDKGIGPEKIEELCSPLALNPPMPSSSASERRVALRRSSRIGNGSPAVQIGSFSVLAAAQRR